jgi:hypothetical protein
MFSLHPTSNIQSQTGPVNLSQPGKYRESEEFQLQVDHKEVRK